MNYISFQHFIFYRHPTVNILLQDLPNTENIDRNKFDSEDISFCPNNDLEIIDLVFDVCNTFSEV